MKISSPNTLSVIAALLALIASATAQAAEPQQPEPVATAEAIPSAETTPQVPITVSPLSANVFLTNGSNLIGTLTSSTDLTMKTSFGDANIPLSEVAGIKMASEDNAVTTVVLHNGDSVTGATELERIELQTEWGEAVVNAASVISILFAQDLQWISEDSVAGTRWRLTGGQKPAAAKPAAAKAPAPRPAARPTSMLPYYYGQ